MINIYYYKNPHNKAQAYNWGFFTVISYYINNNKDKKISINEIIDLDDFKNIENNEDTFILLSIPFFESISSIDAIMQSLKEELKDIKYKKYNIVLGGAANHQISSEDIHKFYPEIDFIVWGRGEVVLEKILNKEITTKGAYDGNKYDFKQTIMLDFFSKKIDKVSIPIMIDGLRCPWNKCKFCLHSTMDKTNMKADEVFRLIKRYYIEQGRKKFYICDNWLNMGKAYKLFDMLFAEGMTDVSFEFFGVHISSNYKRLGEYINKFNDGFITASSWGVEYLDDEILELYQKGITVDKILEHAKIITEFGMSLDAYMILGLPHIEKKHINNMYENLLKYDKYVNFYSYSTFTLDENIDVFKNNEDFGVKIKNRSTLDYQYDSKYPLRTTIFDYEVYDFENEKYMTPTENVERFSSIISIMEEKNKINNYSVRTYMKTGIT